MMMTLAQTYSWIFYALALASRTMPAKYRDIEQVADGINHAIPTQKEIRESLAWLVTQDFVVSEGKSFQLSVRGTEVLDRLSSSKGTTMGVWLNIERYFEECGVNNTANVDPNTLT